MKHYRHLSIWRILLSLFGFFGLISGNAYGVLPFILLDKEMLQQCTGIKKNLDHDFFDHIFRKYAEYCSLDLAHQHQRQSSTLVVQDDSAFNAGTGLASIVEPVEIFTRTLARPILTADELFQLFKQQKELLRAEVKAKKEVEYAYIHTLVNFFEKQLSAPLNTSEKEYIEENMRFILKSAYFAELSRIWKKMVYEVSAIYSEHGDEHETRDNAFELQGLLPQEMLFQLPLFGHFFHIIAADIKNYSIEKDKEWKPTGWHYVPLMLLPEIVSPECFARTEASMRGISVRTEKDNRADTIFMRYYHHVLKNRVLSLVSQEKVQSHEGNALQIGQFSFDIAGTVYRSVDKTMFSPYLGITKLRTEILNALKKPKSILATSHADPQSDKGKEGDSIFVLSDFYTDATGDSSLNSMIEIILNVPYRLEIRDRGNFYVINPVNYCFIPVNTEVQESEPYALWYEKIAGAHKGTTLINIMARGYVAFIKEGTQDIFIMGIPDEQEAEAYYMLFPLFPQRSEQSLSDVYKIDSHHALKIRASESVVMSRSGREEGIPLVHLKTAYPFLSCHFAGKHLSTHGSTHQVTHPASEATTDLIGLCNGASQEDAIKEAIDSSPESCVSPEIDYCRSPQSPAREELAEQKKQDYAIIADNLKGLFAPYFTSINPDLEEDISYDELDDEDAEIRTIIQDELPAVWKEIDILLKKKDLVAHISKLIQSVQEVTHATPAHAIMHKLHKNDLTHWASEEKTLFFECLHQIVTEDTRPLVERLHACLNDSQSGGWQGEDISEHKDFLTSVSGYFKQYKESCDILNGDDADNAFAIFD